jgi:hypothetical protein
VEELVSSYHLLVRDDIAITSSSTPTAINAEVATLTVEAAAEVLIVQRT